MAPCLSLLLLLSLAQDGSGAPLPPTEPEPLQVLVLGLQAQGIDDATAATLTSLVVQNLAQQPALDVVSGSDIQDMARLAAGREQLADCSGDSCLAEISAALGTRYVVSGQVGTLGALKIVSLSLFDAEAGRVIARERAELTRLEDAPVRLAPATHNLLAEVLQQARVDDPPSSSDAATSSGESGGAPTEPPAAPASDEGGPLSVVATLLQTGGGVVAGLALGSGALAYVATVGATALLYGLKVETAYSAVPLAGPLLHIGTRPDLNLQSRVIYYISFGFQALAIFVATLGAAAAGTGFLLAPPAAEGE